MKTSVVTWYSPSEKLPEFDDTGWFKGLLFVCNGGVFSGTCCDRYADNNISWWVDGYHIDTPKLWAYWPEVEE